MANLLVQLLPLVALFAVFYFFIIRPENKRKKEYAKLIESLKVNDNVMTTGGVIGKIVSLDDDTVVIETSFDRTKIKFSKNSILKLMNAKEN